MGIITKIEQQKDNSDRFNIYIDNEFCTGIPKIIAKNLKLKIGDEWNCEKLKKKIDVYWKEIYKNKWKEEKERIEAVIKKIKEKLPSLEFEIFGFGADTNQLKNFHPIEKGIPDVLIIYKKNNFSYVILFLEITGTKRLKEDEKIWIRPDKIKFAEKHPNLDIFIAHYINELDLVRFISTKNTTEFPEPEVVRIYNREEEYIKLPPNHPSVKDIDSFISYLEEKIKNIK